MKKLFLLFFIIRAVNCYAQDTTVVLSQRILDKIYDRILLCQLDGWRFKTGSDTAWARKDINTTGWEKLRPVDLSVKYADKNGRVECWFRIKVKLDSTFGNQVFGITGNTWDAADYYVDGRLVSSLGNTGENGQAFREFMPYPKPAVPVDLKPGVAYTIAIHFVDHLAPLPPVRLRSNQGGLILHLISLTGPMYNSRLFSAVREIDYWVAIWVSVCVVLSTLFWFLYIQNRFEKNLKLIALNSTFLALTMFFLASTYISGISYIRYYFGVEAGNFFAALSVVSAPLIIAGVFKRKVSVAVKVFIAFYAIIAAPIDLLPPAVNNVISICLNLITFGICLYYIISSWKNLKGAQWSIVVGLLISLADVVAIIIYGSAVLATTFYFKLLVSIYAFSFPLSLLVYVAMRFKEILKEVQLNANQVVQLSEEKKQEALNRQKILEEEVSRQTAQIKANQAQLIQSEKMASLGELTAGIAHEIQNPLNFVNNFSEVSVELLDEIDEELDKGDIQEAKTIGADLKQNLQKIQHHGKRADFIVKGMLEHSRTNTGEKQLTDMNVLCDEFLKLSYHGLRAKDKSFNAEMITHFDPALPKVNVSQQDMGRVMLNLFNNAFYAVNQKLKTLGAAYTPEVTVTTFAFPSGGWGVKVKDNGIGIPDSIKEKIMQPFFTTKPTGEGTGLGLSLTYDMVVKGHGGTISVESKENLGSEFIINLPIS